MATARFRFYEELNDFLAPERRKREFDYRCARAATVKNAIEALGVPHTEVELVLVNGASVDFSHIVREGDRVAVYPRFESFDIRPLLRVRPEPLRETRFVADTHLGGLARLLRTLGFDTVYGNGLSDEDIVSIAAGEGRVILTRDKALLKRREVTHGCFVHAVKPREQMKELVERLQLASSLRPYSRCVHCNGVLRSIDKAAVLEQIPASVARRYDEFLLCPPCDQVYWVGDHWREMRALLGEPDPRGSGLPR